MAEVGAEDSHIIAAAISHTNYGFRPQLIGNAETGSKGMPVVRDVSVEADPTNTSNAILTLDDIRESAVL